MKGSLLIQWLAACVMMASALIVLKGTRTAPVLVLDENREMAMLSEMSTGADAEYARGKTVLLNLGAVLAGTWPFEDDDRASKYLKAWVVDDTLFKTLWGYRTILASKTETKPERVLLRTEKGQRIQIYRRADRQGFVANATYTPLNAALAEQLHFSFDTELVKTRISPMNPMGYALQRCKPLDDFWKE